MRICLSALLGAIYAMQDPEQRNKTIRITPV
jgi:hypothetical protein